MKRDNIRIAIQKKGRLHEDSINYLSSAGIECSILGDRRLLVPCLDSNIEVIMARQSDILQYVQQGAADFGIVGGNTLYESSLKLIAVEILDFGKCELVIAVPAESNTSILNDLEGERIATSYPNSLKRILNRTGVNAAIVPITGSVEVTPGLGLADAICDISQSGDTLRANGLRPISIVLRSQAALIESPDMHERKSRFKQQYGIGMSPACGLESPFTEVI
jgi:ATP phosphoribosyltransferase